MKSLNKPGRDWTSSLASTSLALLTIATLGACGRATKVYPDTPAIVSTEAQPILVDGRSVLPSGLFNQSVNSSLVDVQLDETTPESRAIRLMTFEGSNAVGGFNGSGQGNRALLGIAKYSSQALADLQTISFDFKRISGTEGLSLTLIVDLSCDGANIRAVQADAATLGAGSTQNHNYTRITADFSAPLWMSSDADFVDPADPAFVMLSSTTPSSFNDLIARYPAACIKNASSLANALPKQLPTAGILIGLGTDSTTDKNGLFINRISVGSEVIAGLE